MGHEPVGYPSSSRHPLAALLRAERQRQGLTQAEVAKRVRQAASDDGTRDDRANEDSVRRWETGVTIPYPSHQRWIATGLGLPLSQVTAAAREQARLRRISVAGEAISLAVQPGETDPVSEAQTLQIAQELLASRTDPRLVETVAQATDRLCRLYSTSPPAVLLPRVQFWLLRVRDLMQSGIRLRDHAALLTSAGWQSLLLAALHHDLGHHEAAHASRGLAVYLSHEVGDGEIEGWAYETASWFAIYDGPPTDVIEAAEAGLIVSPHGSAAAIMNTLKLATAYSRTGNRSQAERAIDQAATLAAALPAPQHPDHHFTFDPPKLDLYASRTYAWLGMPEEVERHARSVLAQNVAPSVGTREQRYFIPTRTSMARLDLATALLDRSEVEAACHVAGQAFGPLVRRDIVKRGIEFSARLREHGASTYAERFHEHLMEVRQQFARQQAGSSG